MQRFTLLIASVASACTAMDTPRWELVWEDDFQGAAGDPPNAEIWTYDVGGDGWGNNQLEHNTDRPENVSLDGNGFLKIVARREAYEGNAYTSARIKTQGLKTVQYGRVEARIQLPAGTGIWPAFWMLGADIGELGWPSCGEIDILELRGDQPTEVLGTLHGPGYAGDTSVGGSLTTTDPVTGTFHTYAIEWDPDHITWFFDDRLVYTANPGDLPSGTTWVYDHEFFLLLNLAVGGNFLDDPDDTTSFPATMGVDYVRVYQRTTPLMTP